MTPAQLITRYIADRKAGKILCPALRVAVLETGDIEANEVHVATPYHEEGPLWSLGYHTGEDHPCPVGSLAVSVSYGQVVAAGAAGAGYGRDYGNVVVVRSRSGYDAMFCHLSVIRSHVGELVRPGQVLGLTGATGHVTAAHLHFEVRPAGGRFGSDVRPINVKQKGHPQ